MTSLIRFPAECPVCKSPLLSLAKQISTELAGVIDLFYCMECESFSSPFAPENLRGSTLNHHLKVFERNQDFTLQFLRNIEEHIRPNKILDVGCGIGSLLYSARFHAGIEGIGFDVDSEATEYGRTNFNLDLRGVPWSSAFDAGGDIDLITCIMVLEHIKLPRPLISELIIGARNYNCMLYVSVPWFNRSWWKHLTAPNVPDSPINAPWDHVTHFSDNGFIKVCKEMRVTSIVHIPRSPWAGFLIKP